jgi:GTPase SAR1 family protein
MVKLLFNPKDQTNGNLLKSKTSKKTVVNLESVNFNPFLKHESTSYHLGTLTCTNYGESLTCTNYGEAITCTNIVGLNNCHFVLKQWFYNETNKIFLIIGPTGCGKTTLINSFCQEETVFLLNIKSNDNKIKRDVLKDIEIFLQYNQIFFKQETLPLKKKLLLIDEYQNGPNDIFSITDIISLHEKYGKTLKILIIASDSKGTKLSDLKKICEIYYINEIPKVVIKNWIVSLKTDLNQHQINYLIENCKSDKRLILNALNLLKNSTNLDLNTFLKEYYKDEDINVFEYIK